MPTYIRGDQVMDDTVNGQKITDESLETQDIKNGTILLEDLSQEVIDAMGGAVLYEKTRNPNNNDDLSDGYNQLDYWFNTNNKLLWICRDNTNNSAQWEIVNEVPLYKYECGNTNKNVSYTDWMEFIDKYPSGNWSGWTQKNIKFFECPYDLELVKMIVSFRGIQYNQWTPNGQAETRYGALSFTKLNITNSTELTRFGFGVYDDDFDNGNAEDYTDGYSFEFDINDLTILSGSNSFSAGTKLGFQFNEYTSAPSNNSIYQMRRPWFTLIFRRIYT